MLDDRLKITTGVPESEQESSFMNATLQGCGEELSVSIAVTLPDHMQDMCEAEAVEALREDFKHLTQIGYEVEIQIGPSRDYEQPDEDDEDYDEQGNLKAGCGHNDELA